MLHCQPYIFVLLCGKDNTDQAFFLRRLILTTTELTEIFNRRTKRFSFSLCFLFRASFGISERNSNIICTCSEKSHHIGLSSIITDWWYVIFRPVVFHFAWAFGNEKFSVIVARQDLLLPPPPQSSRGSLRSPLALYPLAAMRSCSQAKIIDEY